MATPEFNVAALVDVRGSLLSQLTQIHYDVASIQWLAKDRDGRGDDCEVNDHAHRLVKCTAERVMAQLDKCRALLGAAGPLSCIDGDEDGE